MRMSTVMLIFLVLVVLLFGIVVFGRLRWRRETKDFRSQLSAARLPPRTVSYSARELETLPAPVQRYFQAVLQDGQQMITAARFREKGQFRLSESQESWGPFRATQVVTVLPPAFDWDARIRWAPGVDVFVRDAYFSGTGILHAAAFGFFTVMEQRGTPELAQGELMRYLAEAPWYPTALLPSHGVHWEAVDDSTARASITDRSTSVSLEFLFDSEGLISVVRSPGRYRELNGVQTLVPWQGRFRAYSQVSGVRIPLEGEVEWVLPMGPLPYWRGRILEMEYELAR